MVSGEHLLCPGPGVYSQVGGSFSCHRVYELGFSCEQVRERNVEGEGVICVMTDDLIWRALAVFYCLQPGDP